MVYVTGYGTKKHIRDDAKPHTDNVNDGYGLCGAYGGHPQDGQDLPVCKRCLRIAEKATHPKCQGGST